MLGKNIIEVKRERGSEVYLGRTKEDAKALYAVLHSNYFYRASYTAVFGMLATYGFSLLVEEPFDEEPDGAKPLPGKEGDLWVP
ncbi:MAG: hypothetical protein ACXWP0_01110 [Ktedonobacterales bacterium]